MLFMVLIISKDCIVIVLRLGKLCSFQFDVQLYCCCGNSDCHLAAVNTRMHKTSHTFIY